MVWEFMKLYPEAVARLDYTGLAYEIVVCLDLLDSSDIPSADWLKMLGRVFDKYRKDATQPYPKFMGRSVRSDAQASL